MYKNVLKLALFITFLAKPFPALADRHHDGGGWRGEIGHFHEHDFHRWSAGHWYHGPHGGRLAWWWIVGDFWYWYPNAVYPYPNPYTPPVVIQTVPVAPPEPPAPPAPAAAPSVWYYCDQAATYYPYVPECPGGWRAVPATPPAPVPSTTPPPPR